MLRFISLSTVLSILFGVTPLLAQRRRAPEDQLKLNDLYFAQEKKCRGLLHEERWKEAEAACAETVRLADRFADQRELEKLSAYAELGHALDGQKRFREAIKNYMRAVEVARPRLDETNVEIADVYRDIAMSYHALGDLKEARDWYTKTEASYLASYKRIAGGDVSPEGEEMLRGYMKALKRVYELHSIVAEQAGALDEAEELKKKSESIQ